MVKALPALLAVWVGFQVQGPGGYQGPPQTNPGSGARKEPDWALSKLRPGDPEFSKARREIQKQCGTIVGGAFVDPAKSEAAYARFVKDKKPSDAYRALYLWIASGATSEPIKYEALWKALPRDDYEVTRLHFLWGAPLLVNAVARLGDRLLKADPDDLEVMHYVVNLRTRVIPDQDLPRARRYAERLLKELPGPLTYLRYGMVCLYIARKDKDSQAGKLARQYIQKFQKVAHPKDTFHKRQAIGWLKWLTDNGY